MKKIMVTLQLKEKVSLLIDVEDKIYDKKTYAKEQALNEFRRCFDSQYYKAFLKHHDFNKSLEVLEVPEFINVNKKEQGNI